MNRRADRNRLERKRVADFRRSRRTAGNFCADLHADRRDDVTLLAVLVFQQRQTRRTHRIVFNRRDRRFHAVLVALEIHEADFLLVPAADAARGHATVMVAAAGLLAVTTSDFSGVVFVMSLKSAIVMYRVDGVSGLKCLTGINAKVFLSATLKLAGHHSCPCWESVIGPQTCCPFNRNCHHATA